MPPSISFVVLNFNGGALLAPCVDHALAQDGVEAEVIVVDNGSTDDSLSTVASRDGLVIHRIGHNAGFAAGMNAGYSLASADVVVPLNCDAFVPRDFAVRALAVMDRHPMVGAVGALVFRVAANDAAAGRLPMTHGMLDGGAIDLLPNMSVWPDPSPSSRQCFKPNGACPVLRRQAIEESGVAWGIEGPYDRSFVTYGEDIDLAFRMWRTGWVTYFDSDLTAAHVRSFASASSVADKRGPLRRLLLRSRYFNAWRHLPRPVLPIALAALLATDLAFVVLRVLRGDPQAGRDVSGAWRDVVARRGQLRGPAQPRRFRPVGVFRLRSPRRTLHEVESPRDHVAGA